MINISFDEFYSKFFSSYKAVYDRKESNGWSNTIENKLDAQIEFGRMILLHNELSHAPLKVGDMEKLHDIVYAVTDYKCRLYIGDCYALCKVFWNSYDGSLLNVSEPVF